MEQLYISVMAILTLVWAIVCFILYHKVFTVFYFSAVHGIFKEILVCLFLGCALAALTLMFSTYLAVGLVLFGFVLTRNIESAAMRNTSFALITILAVTIFFTGKWFQDIMESENTAHHSDYLEEYNDHSYSEPLDTLTVYTSESIPEAYITIETEPQNNPPVETYQNLEVNSYVDTPVVSATEEVYITGYVIESSGGLKIRNGPGTSYQEVGRLAPNEHVVIYEQIYGESYMWGKIDRGWICMDYIVVGTATNDRDTYAVGYIVGSKDGVNIRSGPAVSYEQVGRAYQGQQVTVTKLHNNGVSEWGYIGEGWICTDYIHFGDTPPGSNYYGDFDPADSSISSWDTGEPQFAGYDSYGRELRVGYYVCIGARQGSSEYAVGTIVGIQDNGIPVVEFTDLYNNNYPEEILYCMNDLADKINYFGYYCGEIEAQYLQMYIWG